MSGRILIVDPSSASRIVLKVKLAAACHATVQAATGAEGLAAARSLRPDAILLALDLPDMDGLALLRALAADPATAPIPVIAVAAEAERGRALAALQVGAADVLARPVDEGLLLARLRQLIRLRAPLAAAGGPVEGAGLAEDGAGWLGPPPAVAGPLAPGLAAEPPPEAPARVALLSGCPAAALAWRRALAAPLGVRPAVLTREEALADGPPETAPDLFLIAADLGRPGEGLRLASELLSRPRTRHAAICVVLPAGLPAAERAQRSAVALDLGAGEVLGEPIDPVEAAARLAALVRRKRAADRARQQLAAGLRLAVLDPLLGIWNRRYALPRLEAMAACAGSGGARRLAVLLLDLDRFKAVNDRWGHAAGDAVLVEVARRLRAALSPEDLIARIGGEEFLVVLGEAAAREAEAVAERLCRVIEAAPVRLPGGAGEVPVTVSIGLAIGGGREDPATAAPGAALLQRADEALRAAKRHGRNRVAVGRTAA